MLIFHFTVTMQVLNPCGVKFFKFCSFFPVCFSVFHFCLGYKVNILLLWQKKVTEVCPLIILSRGYVSCILNAMCGVFSLSLYDCIFFLDENVARY